MTSGSGWNLWVWLAGGGCGWNLCVASGCGCKEVYKFLPITYPYSSCICYFFAAASLLFVLFLKCFSFLLQYFFLIKFSVFFAQYKHTYGRLRTSHGSHMKERTWMHIMFYTRRSTHKRTLHSLRWTSAVCLQGVGYRSRSRGCALLRAK